MDLLLPRAVPRRRRNPGPARDDATWYGLGAASLMLLTAMALGGSLAAYCDLPAFLMVIVGTAAVTMISFPLRDTLALPKVMRVALFQLLPPAREHALRLLSLSGRARRLGLFALEDMLSEIGDNPFLARGIAMAIDHVPADQIERTLRTEQVAVLQRHRAAADILRRGGEVAPAMGLIGTLVGLVQMLGNLNTPSSIGPAMAVAILATLYGAVLANMVLLPFAGKLDRNNQAETLLANLTLAAAVSIAGGESPHQLALMLNSILPPAARVEPAE